MTIERNFLLLSDEEERGEPPHDGQKKHIVGVGALHADGHCALDLRATFLRFPDYASLVFFLNAFPERPAMALASERFSPENTQVSFTDEKGTLVASWSRESGLIAHSLRVVEAKEAEPWMLGQEDSAQEGHEQEVSE